MYDKIITRHEIFRNYVLQNSYKIRRGEYWSNLSSDFEAKIENNGYINIKKSNYFPGIIGRDDLINGEFYIDAISAYKRSFKEIQNDHVSFIGDNGIVTINNKKYFIGGERSGLFYGNIYIFNRIQSLFPLLENFIEVGGGSGFLAALLHDHFKTKITIIDLPEMLTVSSAFLLYTFPERKFLLPNEVESDIDISNFDFILITPDQICFLPEHSYFLGLNKASFMEMDKNEVENYFFILDKLISKDGYFYCSNRPVKKTIFFNYPWSKQINYDDVLFELNRFKLYFPNEFIDRLRKKNYNSCFEVQRNDPNRSFYSYCRNNVINKIWNINIRKKYPWLAFLRNWFFKKFIEKTTI